MNSIENDKSTIQNVDAKSNNIGVQRKISIIAKP